MDIYRAGGYNDGTWFTASPHEPFKLLHFRASAAHGQTVLLFRGQDASFSPVMRRSIDDERLRRIDTENAALAKTRHSQHGATSVKPRVPVCSSG
jgi:glutamate formiminotransferase